MAIDLTTLDGFNGFVLSGSSYGDKLGSAVSGGGDFDGDGNADFIIADTDRVYLVFGRDSSSFGANFDVTTLNGSNGFAMTAGFLWGSEIDFAGDINGDGFDDIIIGVSGADTTPDDPTTGKNTGISYVVFGGEGGFDPELDLNTLDGENGFIIHGAAAGNQAGSSVAGAGDINGDGIDDLLIGARMAEPVGVNDGGAGYVLFGTTEGFDPIFNLGSLNGSNGFQVRNIFDNGVFGTSVSSLGDFNGDGLNDAFFGAPNISNFGRALNGGAFAFFGSASGFNANISNNQINGNNGIHFVGQTTNSYAGYDVTGVGDFNNDGFDDAVIGASGQFFPGVGASGGAYLVFGGAGGFGRFFDLNAINGINGFRLQGGADGDKTAYAVSGAGDINDDGFDDFIISAHLADSGELTNNGAVYIVFGHDDYVGQTFDLSALDPNDGFRIDGITARGILGREVTGIGDVNGDGIDDILVAAPHATVDGIPTNASGLNYAGESYVIFGSSAFGSPLLKPQANMDEYLIVLPDNEITFNVLDNDFSPLAGVLQIDSFTDVNNGTLVDNGGGSFTYTADPGFINGTDSFTYILSDGTGSTSLGLVLIDVLPTFPPEANDDVAGAFFNFSTLINVLANDSDSDGGTLVITDVSSPGSGTTSIEDGRIRFTPAQDFTGVVNFTYTIEDGQGGSDTANVQVTVGFTDFPTANDDDVSTFTNFDILIDVLANDSDPDGGTLEIIDLLTAPAFGTAVIEGDEVRYTPPQGFTGVVEFSYQLGDGQGGTDTATVTVNVGDTEQPDAGDDFTSTLINTAVEIDALANDSDPDGGTLVIDSVGTPSNGTAQIQDGKILYTPDTDFAGIDTFTYTMEDGQGGSDSATVEVLVRPPAQPFFPVVTFFSNFGEQQGYRADFILQVTEDLVSGGEATEWAINVDLPEGGSFRWIELLSGPRFNVTNDASDGTIKSQGDGLAALAIGAEIRFFLGTNDLDFEDGISFTFTDLDDDPPDDEAIDPNSNPGFTAFEIDPSDISLFSLTDFGATYSAEIDIIIGPDVMVGNSATNWRLDFDTSVGSFNGAFLLGMSADVKIFDPATGIFTFEGADIDAGDTVRIRLLGNAADFDLDDFNIFFNQQTAGGGDTVPIPPDGVITLGGAEPLSLAPEVIIVPEPEVEGDDSADLSGAVQFAPENVSFANVSSYGAGNGFNVTFTFQITADLLDGGEADHWQIDLDADDGIEFAAGVLVGISSSVADIDFDAETGILEVDGFAVEEGDEVTFRLIANDGDFDMDAFAFSFTDLDEFSVA